jgi:hypothetical protein
MGRYWVCVIFVAVGCAGDGSAVVRVVGTMGVGTYAALDFADACQESHANLCSTETVQRLESVTVEPAGMLEVVPVNQVPTELLQVAGYQTSLAAHALATGTGRVCLQGLFSDGSHRRACADVTVREIAHVSTALSCVSVRDGVSPQALVPPGVSLSFQIQFQAADGTLLGGDTLQPIDEGAFTQSGAESYVWAAPVEGGSVTFGSRLDAGFSQTLSTYDATEVTAVHAVVGIAPPVVLSPGLTMDFQLAADVGAGRTCIPTTIAVRTDTPDVCTGAQGALTWSEGNSLTSAYFTAVTEGTCHLSFGVPGGNADLGALDVPYYFVQSSDDLTRNRIVGDPCGVPNQQACAQDRTSVVVCRSKKWAVATKCTPGICDYTAPASDCPTSGCAACR